MKGALALLVALALGLAAGLGYAWGVNPVSYTDTSPASLRDDFRADYLTLIAVAYDAGGAPKVRSGSTRGLCDWDARGDGNDRIYRCTATADVYCR